MSVSINLVSQQDRNHVLGLQATSSFDFSTYVYKVSNGKDRENWTDDKGFQPVHPKYTPKEWQIGLIEAVKKALDDGACFYSSEMCDYVANLLNVSDEVRAVGANRVEGGYFGMDVHYARKYVEAQRANANEIAAFEEMSLTKGETIGSLIFNDGKLINCVKIEKLNDDSMTITCTGKRGTNTIGFDIHSPISFKRAIERAHQQKKRKDSYAQFLQRYSGRKSESVAVSKPVNEEQLSLI